jgi:hypothetical protein
MSRLKIYNYFLINKPKQMAFKEVIELIAKEFKKLDSKQFFLMKITIIEFRNTDYFSFR